MKFNEFLHKEFDKIYVINLDSRPDRMSVVKNILLKYKIKYERYSAVYLKDNYTDVINSTTQTSSLGHLGCILSHVYCCKDAVKNNYNKILVLEDDITFIEDHINKINFKELYDELSHIDWSMFYLGATFNSKLTPITKHIDKPQGEVWATQSIGYNKKTIEKIVKTIPTDIEYYLKENRLQKILPIDVIYDKNFKLQKYCINPIVCVQNASQSDIVPPHLMLDNSEYQLSRWLNSKKQ